MVYHKVLFWGPVLFSLFINDLPLHVKDISVDCDMLADATTRHTSGKDIMQIRSNMQDSLDQVSNWCVNNHMVINPIKTKSVTIATRQKHQLSPLPLDLVPLANSMCADHVGSLPRLRCPFSLKVVVYRSLHCLVTLPLAITETH